MFVFMDFRTQRDTKYTQSLTEGKFCQLLCALCEPLAALIRTKETSYLALSIPTNLLHLITLLILFNDSTIQNFLPAAAYIVRSLSKQYTEYHAN